MASGPQGGTRPARPPMSALEKEALRALRFFARWHCGKVEHRRTVRLGFTDPERALRALPSSQHACNQFTEQSRCAPICSAQ